MALHDWLRRFSRSSVPEGWTDDMSVSLGAGRSVEHLVEYILAAIEHGRQREVLISELGVEFGLSPDDAELSVDRVCGGIARARTGNRANCPDRIKDPIAWASFQRAIAQP